MKQIKSNQIVRLVAGNNQQFAKYLAEIGRTPILSPEEETELFSRLSAGDPTAEAKIIRANLLFVVTVAKQYVSSINRTSLTLEDLVSEGNFGLIKAVHRFEPDRGFKFISYAVFWIKQAIIECIQTNVKAVRIPGSARLTITSATAAAASIEQATGRSATLEEISEVIALDPAMAKNRVTVARLAELLGANQWEKSLSQRVGHDSSAELIDEFSSDESSDSELIDLEKRSVFAAMLQTLSAKHRMIINRYYGLGGFAPTGLRELAEEFSCSPEQVRQRVKAAVRVLYSTQKDKLLYLNPKFRQPGTERREQGQSAQLKNN